MRTIEGVILDVDGTLVDSNDAHARAWVEALAESGRHLPFERVRRLIGMGSDKLVPELTGLDPDSKDGKRLIERRKEIFDQRFVPGLTAFPGVRPLLEMMRAKGLALSVASSATKDDLKRLLGIADAGDLIEEQVSSDDAEQSKPDPDIVQAALKSLRLPADRVLMLGDTPYDVAAARRAGVGIVALLCGGWKAEDLSGALAIYRDPADLLASFAASPFSS
jgi:HAD superfamily hydrolase (TIGR01509 family)